MPTMHRVTALVDWDTARRLVPCRVPTVRHIEEVVEQLQRGISQFIKSQDTKDTYRVYWRIYHGWHQGKTRSEDRLLFERYMARAGATTIRNVSFSGDFELSGVLSCRSTRPAIVDTLRVDRNTGEVKQKMVDTMLVCDLLHLARTREFAFLLVIANDDDFVPALHTAEAWKARPVMLHAREHVNTFLSLDGITARMEAP
jgi:hypothetical protein